MRTRSKISTTSYWDQKHWTRDEDHDQDNRTQDKTKTKVKLFDRIPIPPKSPWNTVDVGAPRSEDPKLIIRAITFEVTQPIRPRYINVTDGRTNDLQDSNTVLCINYYRQ